MVRRGKERVQDHPDQLEAPDTVLAPDDARCWLNGVNCQMQPDAASQRVAASQRAAEKRMANAMPTDERAAKRLADQQRRRKAQQERKQAAAVAMTGAAQEPCSFDMALERVAADAALEVWFNMATRSRDYPNGIELDGNLAEQNTQYDIVARRFRAYSDGRPGVS